MITVKLDTSHKMTTAEVRLSVLVGNAQVGGSVVELDFTQIAQGPDIKDHLVGKAVDLDGLELVVSTVVKDQNTQTNKTSIQYSLGDGAVQKSYALEHTVGQHGDSVQYEARFKLVK